MQSGGTETASLLPGGGPILAPAPSQMTQSPQPKAAPSVSCADRAITAWGWSFDVFLIIVNLTDVVSDCLIARQFWVDGHKTFFGLVLASLLLASVIYTVAGVELLWREKFGNRLPRGIQYLIVLPFSQLVPVANWAAEQWRPSSSGSGDVGHWRRNPSESASGIILDELDAMAGANKVMERLDIALAKHLRSHAFFYVETIVEAIPQAVVQLLAVSFLGDATPLQVFSLALSMVSIISKGYVLSRAFGIPEMAFKFFVGAHDLFSLFYIFATVISSTSSKDVHVAGDLYIDYMSAVWVLKIFITWGYALLCSGAVGLFIAVTEATCRARHVRDGALYFAIGLLAFIPVVILVEGGKLMWLNGLLTILEPSNLRSFPSMAMWYNFCNRAESGVEWDERFRYICFRFIEGIALRSAANRRAAQQRAKHRTAVHSSPQPQVAIVADKNQGAAAIMRQRQELQALRRRRAGLSLGGELAGLLPDTFRRALAVLNEKPRFRPYRMWTEFELSKLRSNFELPSNTSGRLMYCLAGLGVVLYVLGQLYSLVFPFVHFAISWESVSLLQKYCFYGTAASLGVLLLLVRRASRYLLFNGAALSITRNYTSYFLGNLEQYIEDYFLPPHAFFICDAVPSELLPLDIVEVIGSLMSREQLNFRDVTIEDCKRVKERMIDALALQEPTDLENEGDARHGTLT